MPIGLDVAMRELREASERAATARTDLLPLAADLWSAVRHAAAQGAVEADIVAVVTTVHTRPVAEAARVSRQAVYDALRAANSENPPQDPPRDPMPELADSRAALRDWLMPRTTAYLTARETRAGAVDVVVERMWRAREAGGTRADVTRVPVAAGALAQSVADDRWDLYDSWRQVHDTLDELITDQVVLVRHRGQRIQIMPGVPDDADIDRIARWVGHDPTRINAEWEDRIRRQVVPRLTDAGCAVTWRDGRWSTVTPTPTRV